MGLIHHRPSRDEIEFGAPYGDIGPTNGAFLIVEPRHHTLLKPVLRAFDAQVPKDWTLYVIHGSQNRGYAQQAARLPKRRVVFIQLSVKDLTADQYNRLFTNPEFWKMIEAEHILVFQTDAVPCVRAGPLNMLKFGKFGYVGCAYGNMAGKNTYWTPNAFYGVGGLSLRRKSFMMDCLHKNKKEKPEDVTFSNCMAIQETKPSAQDIGEFCAQSGWGNPGLPPKSWGAHKIELMHADDQKKFLQYCPQAYLLTSED
jgi:hypothetical protein